mmetsp:Transcript_62716/g.130377  ORF Transcript_62716/g.130377 Transcript_62716/m.130377 type:complete len:243 (-) Transcript_62716:851-1579(-)
MLDGERIPLVCARPGCWRPAWVEPDGTTFQHCWRQHQREADALRDDIDDEVRCAVPGCRLPAWMNPDTGERFPHCWRRHRQQADAALQLARRDSMPELVANVCTLPGCPRPVWVEGDGTQLDYCSRRHAMTQLRLESARPPPTNAVPPPSAPQPTDVPLARPFVDPRHGGSSAGMVFVGGYLVDLTSPPTSPLSTFVTPSELRTATEPSAEAGARTEAMEPPTAPEQPPLMQPIPAPAVAHP